MNPENISTIISLVFLVIVIGSLFLGIRTSSWDIDRKTYWFAFIGLFIASRVAEEIVAQAMAMPGRDATEILFFLAANFAITGVLVFFYARVAAGRVRNMGKERIWAWMCIVPVVGWIWLGAVPSREPHFGS